MKLFTTLVFFFALSSTAFAGNGGDSRKHRSPLHRVADVVSAVAHAPAHGAHVSRHSVPEHHAPAHVAPSYEHQAPVYPTHAPAHEYSAPSHAPVYEYHAPVVTHAPPHGHHH